ncbi:condensin subunit [Stemphylium lycopersici]|uniref:Condensin subunit n=1 Tax=Stemphylium lycopersici TaxID=183478 RepID=A0A364N8X7_STELY|nr:condensin subunit [Stemphylium lycopersici]
MDSVDADGNVVPGGTCIDARTFILVSCGFSILMDIIIMPIPSVMVWNLQMHRRTKVLVVIVMSLGWIATGVSVGRFIVYYYRFAPTNTDPCAPATKCLFRYLFPQYGSDRHTSYYRHGTATGHRPSKFGSYGSKMMGNFDFDLPNNRDVEIDMEVGGAPRTLPLPPEDKTESVVELKVKGSSDSAELGYKSYAVRTVISGWDESFNSITGLNGSGKSNILDSICFVLGINNLSVVRAQNLQDLIYKRGQAGVTKASVTIVFDNRDKTKSPVGFEEHAQISVTRQIVLGGASKYLINGHRAQQQSIQNLFQSVQLNINNPNFMIAQGKVMQVLNMKAKEILAMLEEAAGTRMFEDRRDKAYKTMAKKEMKVQEIAELLRDEIDPKLEKLRTEKRAFLEFQQTQSELERLTKLVIAHDYIRYNERLQQSAEDLEAKKQRAKDLEESSVRMKKEIEHLQEDIKQTKATREKELRKGGKFQALEEEVKSNSHEIVRLTTILDLKKSSMAEEVDREKDVQKSVKELEKLLQEKKLAYEKAQEKYQTAHAELAKQTEEVEKKEELLQTLQTGVASKEGQEGGYQGQLQDARNRASAAATEQEQSKLRISHLEKQIKEDEPKAKKAKEQNSGLLKDLEALKSQATKLEADLAKLGYNEGQEADMYQQESHLQARIRELRQQADGMRRQVANIDFSYSDPSPNFDRSRVKGLVASLFTLEKEHTRAGTALEICAGGRLYNVVVDSAATGKQLLENGRLKKRVTIIPLNKIAAFKASAEKIGAAQRIAPGKVDLALSLVGYDHEVNAAMEYVFGSTLVCEDAETAKRVTFDPAVRMRSVTLQGDTYDPAGVLSGGSAPQSSGVLITLQKLNEITTELSSQEAQLQSLQATMAREKKKLDAARKSKQELDLKRHEIKLTEEQISGNASSSIIQAVEEMKQTIAQLKEDIKAAKIRQDEANKDAKRIERDMSEFSNNKDSKLAELQTSLEKLKKALAKNGASIKPLQTEMRGAMVDSEQCGSDLAAAQEQLEEVQTNVKSQQQELDELLAEQSRVQDAHDVAAARLSDEQAKLTGFDEELRSLEDAIRSKNSSITEGGLEQQKLGHEMERFHKEQEGAASHVKALEKEYEFIANDSELFGRPGTVYDFKGVNMADAKIRRKSLEEHFQQKKNKINPKVMAMIDSVEKKEASLKKNMSTVVRDKTKIEETIVKLDEYKKEALHKTWTIVNRDFGQIFNELLPGSFAKLDPPEGKTISDGLEVKVMLGKVWKQSLTELSGGQRSLIALSLIMALLQFKPAPMYILDEVDAALDLSHTQNIGRLFKTRFKGSQFIVVSLKDVIGSSPMSSASRSTAYATNTFAARSGYSDCPTRDASITSESEILPPPSPGTALIRHYTSLQEHADRFIDTEALGNDEGATPRHVTRREGFSWGQRPELGDHGQSYHPMIVEQERQDSPPPLEEIMRRTTIDDADVIQNSKLRHVDSVDSQTSTTMRLADSFSTNTSDSYSYDHRRSSILALTKGIAKHVPELKILHTQGSWEGRSRRDSKEDPSAKLHKKDRVLSFAPLPSVKARGSHEKLSKPTIELAGPSGAFESPAKSSSPASPTAKSGLRDRRKVQLDLSIPNVMPDLPARGRSPVDMMGSLGAPRQRSPKTPWVRHEQSKWETARMAKSTPIKEEDYILRDGNSALSKDNLGGVGLLPGDEVFGSSQSPKFERPQQKVRDRCYISRPKSKRSRSGRSNQSGTSASDSTKAQTPDSSWTPAEEKAYQEQQARTKAELQQMAQDTKVTRARRWMWKSLNSSEDGLPTLGQDPPRRRFSINPFKRSNRIADQIALENSRRTTPSSYPTSRGKQQQQNLIPSTSLASIQCPPTFIPPGLNRVPTPPLFDANGEVKGKLADFFFDVQGGGIARSSRPRSSPGGYWDSDALLMSLSTDFDMPSAADDDDEEGPEGPLPRDKTPLHLDFDANASPELVPHSSLGYLGVKPPLSPVHAVDSPPMLGHDGWSRVHHALDAESPDDGTVAALARQEEEERRKFEWLVPEHLPNSPLCPLHGAYVGPSRGLCYWHGRRSGKEIRKGEYGGVGRWGEVVQSPGARSVRSRGEGYIRSGGGSGGDVGVRVGGSPGVVGALSSGVRKRRLHSLSDP